MMAAVAVGFCIGMVIVLIARICMAVNDHFTTPQTEYEKQRGLFPEVEAARKRAKT